VRPRILPFSGEPNSEGGRGVLGSALSLVRLLPVHSPFTRLMKLLREHPALGPYSSCGRWHA
jgi:hypothetical protein